MSDKKISDFSVANTLNNTDEIILGIGNSWYRITYLAFKNLLTTLTTEQINKINSVVIAGNGTRFATDNGTYRILTIDDLPNTVLSLDSLFSNIGNGISIEKSIENNQAIFKLDINTYTSGVNYTVGYWVLYDNSLYQCNTAHTSTATFDVTKWDIKVGGSSADTMLKSVYDTDNNGIVDNAENTQKIQGVDVSDTTPTDGQSLKYNLTNLQYEPTDDYAEMKARILGSDSVSIIADDINKTLTLNATVSGLDFTAMTSAMIGGIKTGINITADDVNKVFNFEVTATGGNLENWEIGKSYSLYDTVVYSNAIYQCTTANSDVTWTPANWHSISSGADGINAYCWIKYSAIQPTQDSDMSDTPNEWIGIYSGTSATAPTIYSSYTWYKIKGEQGIQGDTGTDGSHIYYGTACTGTSETGVVFATGITNANVDDSYINTSTSYLYRCNLGGDDTTATWVYVNSLKGADGSGVAINDTSTDSTTETWSVNKINTTKQDKITVSSTLTLTVAGWDSGTKTQSISDLTIDTNKLNTPLPSVTSIDEYADCRVKLNAETSTSLTFICNTIPNNNLTFNLKSEAIT